MLFQQPANETLVTGFSAADRLLDRIRKRNPSRAAIVGTYLVEMRVAVKKMHRALRPDGHIVLIVANGTVAGKHFPTVRFLKNIVQECGFTIRLELIDVIRSRGLMTKRNPTAGLIKHEWVLLLQKESVRA